MLLDLAIRLLENLYPIISKSCKIVVIILGRTNWVASQSYECARYSSKYANQFHLIVCFKSIILHFVKKNQLYYILSKKISIILHIVILYISCPMSSAKIGNHSCIFLIYPKL
jgi:low affinity Fe/Cu permease